MRGGDEDLRHHILLARCHAGTALAAPALGAIGGEGYAFDVAAMTDGDDHVLALDQVLVLDLTFHFHDLGEPRRSELRLDVGELSLDDVDDAGPRRENAQVLLDFIPKLLELVADLVAPERGQSLQAQIEDGTGLLVGEADGA